MLHRRDCHLSKQWMLVVGTRTLGACLPVLRVMSVCLLYRECTVGNGAGASARYGCSSAIAPLLSTSQQHSTCMGQIEQEHCRAQHGKLSTPVSETGCVEARS